MFEEPEDVDDEGNDSSDGPGDSPGHDSDDDGYVPRHGDEMDDAEDRIATRKPPSV